MRPTQSQRRLLFSSSLVGVDETPTSTSEIGSPIYLFRPPPLAETKEEKKKVISENLQKFTKINAQQ